MTENPILKEKLERIKRAVRLEPVDRIPFVSGGNTFFARAGNVTIADCLRDLDLNVSVQLDVLKRLGCVDATQSRAFTPLVLPAQWMADVAVPGEDIGDDEMWQMMEKPYNITDEDYQFILDKGFGPFYEDYLQHRLKQNYTERLKAFRAYGPTAKARFDAAGYPCLCEFVCVIPFEYLCGGRSLEVFYIEDLLERPELMDRLFERIMAYDIPRYEAMFERIRPAGVWVGGWRSAPEMISPAMFDRFVWPYLKEYALMTLRHGALPIFHLDANWDLALPRFLELPKGSCVLALDGKTDIYKAKEILGDHMCIMGDIRPELSAFGTPAALYEKSMELMKNIGPRGFILSTGCDIPSNAPFENVRAICRAAEDFRL